MCTHLFPARSSTQCECPDTVSPQIKQELSFFSFFLLAAGTVHSSSERLEKEELRAALEDALQRAQEQHQKEVAELERRLQAFDQAENKVQQAYQEEADRCRSLQQQVGPFRDIQSQ